MSLSRRDFVRLAGLIAGGAAVGGACAPLAGRLAEIQTESIGWPAFKPSDFHRLARLTFGPTPYELDRVAKIGFAGWIEEQLSPESVEDPGLAVRLRRFDSLQLEAAALEGHERAQVGADLRAATILRRTYSRRQLYERWVEFWTDHFNISIDKGDCWLLKPVDDRVVIRPHVFGSFEALLSASAHSPAMLVYLDNQANRNGAPNENYAREVMELHTLGVDGGYNQRDVMELARCLTGWSVKDHFWKGEFTFDAELHDPGSKRVLDKEILPAGEAEAQRVMEMLAVHQATADHLAMKLVGRFVCDDPVREAPGLVRRVSNAFRRTDGDLKKVARTLFLDGVAQRAQPLPPKIKRPVDLVVSALRGLSARTDGGTPLQAHLAAMGQPLFSWPTPDGPPDAAPPWSGNLMPRWQFAIALGLGEIKGTSLGSLEADPPTRTLAALSSRLLGGAPSQALIRALSTAASASDMGDSTATVVAAGLIASPEFQWK